MQGLGYALADAQRLRSSVRPSHSRRQTSPLTSCGWGAPSRRLLRQLSTDTLRRGGRPHALHPEPVGLARGALWACGRARVRRIVAVGRVPVSDNRSLFSRQGEGRASPLSLLLSHNSQKLSACWSATPLPSSRTRSGSPRHARAAGAPWATRGRCEGRGAGVRWQGNERGGAGERAASRRGLGTARCADSAPVRRPEWGTGTGHARPAPPLGLRARGGRVAASCW